MATCHVCPADDNHIPDDEMAEHLRVIHPDVWGEGPQRWPDGEIVVHDLTLEPGDFGGPTEGPQGPHLAG